MTKQKTSHILPSDKHLNCVSKNLLTVETTPTLFQRKDGGPDGRLDTKGVDDLCSFFKIRKIREALHFGGFESPTVVWCIDRFYSFYLTQAIPDFIFIFFSLSFSNQHVADSTLLGVLCLFREKKGMEKIGGSLSCEEKK